MRKVKQVNNKSEKIKISKGKYLLFTFIIVITILLLLVGIYFQYKLNDGLTLSIGNTFVKYIIGIVLILIPILMVSFIIMLLQPKRETYMKSTDFGVDFKELNKKKKEIEVYDRRYVKKKQRINNLTNDEYVSSHVVPLDGVVTNINNDNHNLVEEEIDTDASRFYMLTKIDEEYENYEAPKYNNTITLEGICNSFRNFASKKLGLYYDITDIRRFIGSLAVTKLLILQGMSGTGKTSLAYAFGEYLDNKTVVVPIQPMWKERTDLIGYYNEFTKKFNETTLLYKMYEANNNEEIYITVLDEMNIARVEYYFAEFLSLLELPNPEGRNLDVVSDKWDNDPKLLRNGQLRLPINMWFIGTANNDDSTFAISDKVYDRAMVLNLDNRAYPFEAVETTPEKISITHLTKLYKDAEKEFKMSDRNLRRIRKLDEYMIAKFQITFGNRIMKQIKTYVPVLVACGGNELEAIDDILSRKVLRKLESKNPVYVRSQAEDFCNYIDDLFGQDKMPLCKETIRRIEQNI